MKSILFNLKKLGNASLAVSSRQYHKSSRTHWGVTMPLCTTFARTLSRELTESEILNLAKQLWETEIFDAMMCAAKLLALKKVKPSPQLWQSIIHFLKYVDGWALEDSLAHAAWKCILKDETLLQTDLAHWTRHQNFWMRRAALVYTLPYTKPGRDPELMLQWAASYVNDREWFIQKAIGWWLRELSKHNPERVLAFLDADGQALKPFAKKEAKRLMARCPLSPLCPLSPF